MKTTNDMPAGVMTNSLPGPETVQRPALIRMPSAELSGSSGTPAIVAGSDFVGGGGGVSFGRYLHSLRRKWLVAAVVAVPLAAIATLATWSLQSKVYVAQSTLMLLQSIPQIVFTTSDKELASPYETFKKTQQLLIKHTRVLEAALRNGSVNSLEIVREQKGADLEWLAENLVVQFPGNAELMTVSLSGDANDGLETVVNAVVDSYFLEIVNREFDKKQKRILKLNAELVKVQDELADKRKKLRSLTDSGTSGDLHNLSVIQKTTLDRVDKYQDRLHETQLRLIELREEYKLLTGLEAAPEASAKLSDAEIDALIRNEPAWNKIDDERKRVVAHIETLKRNSKESKHAELLEKPLARLKVLEGQLAAGRTAFVEFLSKPAPGDHTLEQLSRNIDLLENTREKLNAELKKAQDDAKAAGLTSLEVEVVRDEITRLKGLVDTLSAEVRRSEIEMPKELEITSGRIVRVSPAVKPRPVKSNLALTATVAAGGLGFILPFLLFVLLDARHDHINTPTEVTQGLGLSVIGSVPILPRRVMRNLGGSSEGDKYWRTLLSESVDAIAAVLLRGAQPGVSRVIMVSSANAGEGKTTLAAHLAVSLAGAGHRTLLVDFDLRRPALHRVFGVSLDPGVNEILRDHQDVDATIQATQVPNLMMLSAGRWSRTGLSSLGTADLQALFEKLRSAYEFVIVDACPILPVVDTRLIGQHVDAVLLSVLRDVSRAPRLRSACELMDLFGIPILGAVVTGSSQELYSHYESMKETRVVKESSVV